jgi:hypothetical protein
MKPLRVAVTVAIFAVPDPARPHVPRGGSKRVSDQPQKVPTIHIVGKSMQKTWRASAP